jgi:hypothetical protein
VFGDMFTHCPKRVSLVEVKTAAPEKRHESASDATLPLLTTVPARQDKTVVPPVGSGSTDHPTVPVSNPGFCRRLIPLVGWGQLHVVDAGQQRPPQTALTQSALTVHTVPSGLLHRLELQVLPPVQVCPHMPQLLESELRLKQPFGQGACPLVGQVHCPLVQF